MRRRRMRRRRRRRRRKKKSLSYTTFQLLNPCPQHNAKGPHCL
jgi:hypothetical protein